VALEAAVETARSHGRRASCFITVSGMLATRRPAGGDNLDDPEVDQWPWKRLLRQLGVMDDERAVSSQ
jgi:hypothetical protein